MYKLSTKLRGVRLSSQGRVAPLGLLKKGVWVDKRKLDPERVGPPFLTIEVCHKATGDLQGVALVISIPNRDGTLIRQWPSPYGIPSGSQMIDILSVVSKLVEDSLLTKLGVQQVMPLG